MTAKSQDLNALKKILGPDDVKSDPDTLSRYTIDGKRPWAILFPVDVEQVSEVVRLAGKKGLALVPWGSGTKMATGNSPGRLDIVICTTRLNRIVDMEIANLTVTVQAGVRFKDIQSGVALEENRCYLPFEKSVRTPDHPVCSDRENRGCFIPMMPPYSNLATIGGILAADSSGPTRLLYGLPRDMVLGVRYVAPDGEIIGMGGKTVKNVSGYDMCKLMIGSHGSLGILCEMTLKLLPLPERIGTCQSSFSTLTKASGFIEKIFETTLLPAAVELFNRRARELLAPEGTTESTEGGYTVAVALEGFEEAVGRMAAEIGEMASASGAEETLYLEDDSHRAFWDAYSNIATELSVRYPDLVSLKLNYPISHYVQVIEFIDSVMSEKKLDHMLLAHAGNGVSLVHLLVEPASKISADRIVRAIEKLLDHCRPIGGNLIIERAGPAVKQKSPVWGLLREDLVVMKRIKQEMDPLGLFSIGRFYGGI